VVDIETCSFTAAASGSRLDKYVVQQCPDLSRTQVQKLIAGSHILVNGASAKASQKLVTGDKVSIRVPPAPSSSLTPENIPLIIVYEDSDLLVIDKPAGLTVHPAPGHYTGTLVNAVLAHSPDITGGAAARPGVVHRLDKDTSGLIIIAKNERAHMKLAAQFKDRQVNKTYVTLVQGRLTPEEGLIEANIGRSPHDRRRMAVIARGRTASTFYKVIRYIHNYTLLEVRPKTGRTHQIRVHLAAIGFPVVGDATYGVKSLWLDRQFLHARKLGFKLPSTGEYREFESALPPDLAQTLQKLASHTGK
jgi:23S rRNA pseudouridine1911/1915/1917 synthase